MSGLAQAMAPSKCPFFPIALNRKLCSSSGPAAFSLLQAVSPASAQQFLACWMLWTLEVFNPLLHCVGQGRPHLPPGPALAVLSRLEEPRWALGTLEAKSVLSGLCCLPGAGPVLCGWVRDSA